MAESHFGGPPLNVGLLCDYYSNSAGTIVDHIGAMERYSRHKVMRVPMKGDIPASLNLNRFDAIYIHYTLVACHDGYLTPEARVRLRGFKGLKAVFIQDDYRFVDRTVAALAAIRVHVIFGLAPQAVMDVVYPPDKLPGVKKITLLAGYVPEHLTKTQRRPYEERPIDVGYRARKVPAWLGHHAQLKWTIAERFLEEAPKHGLACDISTRERDRIYGDAWIDFLTKCKAVLGTESGSSVCDFTGEIQEAVEGHERVAPGTPFERLRDLYFKDVDGKVMMNVISPRCFEAASLRTLMVLYPGEYSGVLKAWRHYVPLALDHSNMEEVVSVLRSPKRAERIIERAYEEVAANPAYRFEAMVKEIDRSVEDQFRPEMRSTARRYSARSIRMRIARRYLGHLIGSVMTWLFFRAVAATDWGIRTFIPVRRQSAAREGLKKVYFGTRAAAHAGHSVVLPLLRTRLFEWEEFRSWPFVGSPLELAKDMVSGGDKLALFREMLHVDSIRRNVRKMGFVQTVLRWSADDQAIDLLAYDGEQDLRIEGRVLTAEELSDAVAERGIRLIRWSAPGLGGLGRYTPVVSEEDFPELAMVGQTFPREVVSFLVGRKRDPSWCCRINAIGAAFDPKHEEIGSVPCVG